MLVGDLALIAAAVYSGAAIYISVAEQPARFALDDHAALIHWQRAYGRSRALQESLATLGAVFGALAWWQTNTFLWLAGALILVANLLYTFIGVMPTNRALIAIAPENAGPQSRDLIEKWATLHAGRIVLGFIAMLLFWGALRT